jgi:hypothetical protein
MFLFILSSCGLDDEKITLSCSVTEKVSVYRGQVKTGTEIQKTSYSFRFYKELLEEGIEQNDYTKSSPTFYKYKPITKLLWLGEKNGLKIKPINHTTINSDGSESFYRIFVSVDENNLGYSIIDTLNDKTKKELIIGNLVDMNINRVTGEIVGKDELVSLGSTVVTEVQGLCTKAEKRF